jgi:outer membrane protein
MNEKSINQKSILKNVLKTMVFTIFLLSFLAASSQDTVSLQNKEWTLEDCINYALENNIDIKKQLLLVQGQEDQLLQSKLGMLPNLNAGATHGYNWGNTVDRYTNEFATTRVQSNNFYLGTQFNLFQGLQQVNSVSQNKLDWLATQYDLDLMMDDISIAVAGYYLDILFNQELLAVAREQFGVTNQQVVRMDKMVQAGTLARGDLLNMEAQAATEELLVIEAENRLAISYLTLQQLIDLPVSAGFRIDVPELKPVEAPQVALTPQDVYTTALMSRPEIKSAEYRVQSAEKGVSIARGYLSPILSFNGTWATGYSGAAQQENGLINTSTVPIGYLQSNPTEIVVTDYDIPAGYETIAFDNQLNDNQNKSLQLSLQIPIFNGWQARTAISQAKIMKEDADLNLQKTKIELDKTIQLAYADAVAALKNFNASEKKLQAQQEAFKYSQQKLDVGLLTSVDYNETKKELLRAESELLQAKYRFIYTTTVLDFYMGKPLTLNK